MTDTARDYQTLTTADTTGMDDLFDLAQVPTDADGCPAPVPTCANLFPEPVPVEIAAEILGFSLNALKKQLRKGTIAGFKQETKHGSKWFVDPFAMPAETATMETVPIALDPISAQVPTNAEGCPAPVPAVGNLCPEPVPTDANLCQPLQTIGLETITPGGDHVPVTQLLEILEKQTKELQGAYWRNGRLENQVEELQKVIHFQQEQLTEHMKLLTDSQHKRGWWAKFSSWFFKGSDSASHLMRTDLRLGILRLPKI